MGNDPKTSVVNRYCQVHDVDNLFVIDGSVHVTNGGFNPVLTIMANAYRASDHLVKGWKGTRYRMMRETPVVDCGRRCCWRCVLMLPASSVYYRSTAGEGCARCHEIRADL